MTNTDKIAPGWSVKPRDGARLIVSGDSHGKIATVHLRRTKTDNVDELDRHARLIAAAPEMLEALQIVLEQAQIDADDGELALQALSAIRYYARKAIAKAEGRP